MGGNGTGNDGDVRWERYWSQTDGDNMSLIRPQWWWGEGLQFAVSHQILTLELSVQVCLTSHCRQSLALVFDVHQLYKSTGTWPVNLLGQVGEWWRWRLRLWLDGSLGKAPLAPPKVPLIIALTLQRPSQFTAPLFQSHARVTLREVGAAVGARTLIYRPTPTLL